MDLERLDKLRKKMHKVQDDKRYEHTLGVAYTAANLAACHGCDIEKALIAGLLHDCAKCIPDDEKLKICKKSKINVSIAEQRNLFLLHAKAGAVLARRKYGITDEDILNAICYHTTGRPQMSLLEKIVFIADYIEPGRKTLPNLNTIRKMSYEDPDEALLEILKDTLEYLRNKGVEIDPATEETYRYYLNTGNTKMEE